MPSMISRSKLLLLSAFAVMGLILHLACGGGAKATVPGPPPLTMTVEAPGEGVVVSSPALHVRGQVSQPTATVAVNRQPIAVRTDGRFETDVNLTDGTNTLTFEAWTEATVREGRGSGLLPPSEKAEARVIRTVTYQRGPILLTVSAPQDGATFSTSSIQTSGVVSESDATLTINGNVVSLNASGAFSTTLTLAVGSNTFTYLATGAGPGNRTATVTRTVTYTPPPPPEGPTVTLTEPIEGTLTNAAQVRVSGTVSDPTATLTVNGQGTSMDAQGAFTSLLSPPEGPLTITALATNAAGKTGSDTRHIIIDRTPPRITLTKPVPALVNSKTLELIGNVDDPTAVLSLNNQGIALDASGNFHAFYGLSEGTNHLAFRAVDPAGNVGTLEVDTVCDTIAPVVTIQTPVEGLITNLHSIEVTGRVDDPSATLLVAGKSLKPNADGSFTTTLSPAEGAQLIVALATDPAGNTGHATRSIIVDWTPPIITFQDPTPAENSLWKDTQVPLAFQVNEPATTLVNEQPTALETQGDGSLLARKDLSAAEGLFTMTVTATDRAGNTSTSSRVVQVGLTAPVIEILSPALDGSGQFTTRNAVATIQGRVRVSDYVKPVQMTRGGKSVEVAADGTFTYEWNLLEGSNPETLEAVTRFAHRGQKKVVGNRYTTPFGVKIEWPLNGFVTPLTSTEVKGRVRREQTSVTVNGVPAQVDQKTLMFTAQLPLVVGDNTLVAVGTDAVGNTGQDQVNVIAVQGSLVNYRWDLPASGTRSTTRSVRITGQADLPGIASVTVNGTPMRLSGNGTSGQFEGELRLDREGVNVLLLEARTMAGDTRLERRDVYFQPALPRIRLVNPDSARPGDTIPVQVIPELGTNLQFADINFQGRFLARVSPPFAPVQAQIPADATVGGSLTLEATGQDVEAQQVQARSHVSIYGGGALLVKVFDDRTGLPFRKDAPVSSSLAGSPVITVSIEGGGENHSLDDRGQAALSTALPGSWVKISAPGWVPVWRMGGLKSGQAEALIGARLTPLMESKAQDVGSEGIQIQFADESSLSLSVTPLSSQGLPALLPMGWSPVRAWWLEGTASFPGKAKVTLPTSAPSDLQSALFHWVRWDADAKQWTAVAVGKGATALDELPLPAAGAYVLILRDPAPINPPEPLAGEKLQGVSSDAWRDGLKASTGEAFQVMPTTEAIRGTRLQPQLQLDFDGGEPLPSGLILQADTLESYAMLDQHLIEPETYSQDLALHRFSLLVQADGSHHIQPAGNGLLLRFPVRMSRRLSGNEVVEGRILVGFYHDGTRLLESGTELFGVNGGQVTRDGIQAIFSAGAFASSTLVRLQGEPEAATAWPELSSMSLAKAFQLDVVGTLQKGLGLSFTDLSLDASAKPILLARRVVQGERLILAVGELEQQSGAWTLKVSDSLPPVMEGGAFAVVVPSQAWDWQSGTAYAPGALLSVRAVKAGLKAQFAQSGDQPLADVVLNSGWFKSGSMSDGRFAVPALVPASGSITVNAERRDLGLSGTLEAGVPASGLELRLATIPFKLLAVEPAEGAVVGLGEVMEIAASAPIDPASIQDVRLYQLTSGVTQEFAKAELTASLAKPSTKTTPKRTSSASAKRGVSKIKHALMLDTESGVTEISVRRSLSQDGRTLLLIPEQPLQSGADYKLTIQSLKGLSGELLPLMERHFKAVSQPIDAGVDFSRMKLSYPNEQFDVTITVPAGAAPAWSAVEVEAPGFGSSGTAIMPPLGDLSFQLKAGLGETLVVTVHLRDGSKVQGTLSRYVAEDGRTTLSQAGGRVEGPGGLAMVIQPGALDKPAEFQLLPLTEPAQVAEGALQEGEKVKPALKVQIKGDITFTQMPVFEFPETILDSDADTESRPVEYFGNGPLAVMVRRTATLPDGTQDEYLQLVDTASVQTQDGARKVLTMGGLRMPDAENAVYSKVEGKTIASIAAAPGKSVSAPVERVAASDCANRKVAGVNIPPPALGTGYGNWDLALYVLQFPALQTGFRYNSGRVYRNYNTGEGCATPSEGCYAPLPGAEVYRGKRRVPGVNDAQRGRILALTDDCGRYVINGIPVYDPSGNPASTAGSPTIPVNTYNAVDPRTGSCSEDNPIDPGGHVNKNTDYWIWIKTQVNPFDPNLRPPRILASLRDAQGLSRTVFHIGQAATLHLEQGTDSVPVTMVKVKGPGGLDRSGTNLPMDIQVEFATEGTWKTEITGWSAAKVQTNTSVEVLVTPYSNLPASRPGKAPYLVAYEPQPDAERDPENKVSPSDVVKLTFSEPVKLLNKSAIWMKKVDPSTGNTESLEFRILSDGSELVFSQSVPPGAVNGYDTLVAQLWLVPTQRWPLGAKIKVGLENNIIDQDREYFEPMSWSFTVRDADPVGAIQSGTLSDMVVHNGKLYAVEKLGESLADPYWDAPGYPVSGLRIFDVSSPNRPSVGVLFGAHGAVSPVLNPVYATFEQKRPDMILKDGTGRVITAEPFYQHRIRMIRKAEGISLNGRTRDVLLVGTAPRVASLGRPIFVPNVQNQQGATTWLTNSTMWVFDITGDASSLDANGAPKLLMSTTIGKTTGGTSIFGLPSGLGSAGDYLGVIWRLAGLKILSAPNWRQAFTSEAAALGYSEAQLARRSRRYEGYYPGGGSVVATNDISRQHYAGPNYPWIGHSVISGDDIGKPMAFASLGLNGKLVYIDTKTGSAEAMVAYEGSAEANWDDRVQDIGATVENERVLRVETLRGTWQGNCGTEQGMLLLVATDKNFWVLKAKWQNGSFSAVPLAKATINNLSADQDNPWAKVDIQTDPTRMLVGVKSGAKGYVYSLASLALKDNQPVSLVSLFDFKAEGPIALKGGLLYLMGNVVTNVAQIQTNVPSLIIRNIEAAKIDHWDGIPIVTDGSKLFAGAFYDYTASILGNPNPDQTPLLEPKLMYTMIKAQKENDNWPYLRHYYPDLGERYLTATVKMNNPSKEAKLCERDSTWFMEGTAKLFVNGCEVPNAVTLEGLKVENQQLVAETGSTRSKLSKTEFVTTEVVINPVQPIVTVKHSEICAPYRFFIKPGFLSSFDQELREDKEGKSFVRIEFKLYENDEAYRRGNDEGSKQLEFTIKFNSNTTLFDVVRGGAWYYDPVVSGDLPGYAERNPLIQGALDGWANRQTRDVTNCVEFDQTVLRRLSLTKPDRIASQPTDLFGTRADEIKQVDLSTLGLDSIQAMIEKLFVGLRRRVYPDVNGRPSNTEPMPFDVAQDRPTFMWFGNKPSGPNSRVAVSGDVPGAFGYRTAHVVNAIQRLEAADLGAEFPRTLDYPRRWQTDPGLQKEDFEHKIKRLDGTVVADPIDGRIMPVINQRFRIGGELNPTNTLVQYWVAYPRLRTQHEPPRDSSLAAINTMLTRDLVLGPMDPDHASDVAERVGLNTWISRVSAIPEPRDWQGPEREEVYQLFNELQSQECLPKLILEGQTIYRADRNTWGICQGKWYNAGIGILQMAMNPKWGRPFDKTPTIDNPTARNPFVRIIAQPVEGENDDRIRNVLYEFLKQHYKAPRIDVYVNGMATVQPQMERAVDRLQQNLDIIERVSGRKGSGDGTHVEDYRYPQAVHVPVIGVHNLTSVSMDGRAVFFDPWDAQDIFDNQEDAAFPGRPTKNQDSKRLIVVLRELVRVLWDPAFEEDILRRWEKEPEGADGGRAWLANIRKKLTLHAHSQGARVAAVAKTRLGNIQPMARAGQEGTPQTLDVARQFDYVDYGNGAGISMWWKQSPGYRSYVHHVNRYDAVSISVGLYPPAKVRLSSAWDDGFAALNAVLQTNGFLMAPNPLYKNPEGNRWLNIGRNIVTSPHPDIAGELFARYVEAISGLWSHTFVVHESVCKSANTDNHDILGAYLCNLSRDEAEARSYNLVETPWTAGLGTLGYRQGLAVCENGDCGGTDSTTTAIEEGAQLKGLLQVDVEGDLPVSLEAKVEIKGLPQSSYPTPALFVRSVIQHPVLPGAYQLWAYPVQADGKTYWGRIEDLNGNVITSVEIGAGKAVQVKVKYALP